MQQQGSSIDPERVCLGCAPPFDKDACGDPSDPTRTMTWGKKGRKKLPGDYWSRKGGGTPSVEVVEEFLRIRKDANGASVGDKLGPAESQGGGWWRGINKKGGSNKV